MLQSDTQIGCQTNSVYLRSAPMRALFDSFALIGLLAAMLFVYASDQTPPLNTEPSLDVSKLVQESEGEASPPAPQFVVQAPDTLHPIDREPRITVRFSERGRFGVSTTSGNPDDPADDRKRLTYSLSGLSNNTRLWVDGQTPLILADGDGEEETQGFLATGRREALWNHERLEVTQTIELVPGDVSRRMDTILIQYRMRNNDDTEHLVGLRVMLDTLIGGNDGVPFIVPGVTGIVADTTSYQGEQVPDFIRALERPDLTDPGVIVDVGLTPADVERPTEILLSHWPGESASWNYPRRSIGGDSAVGLYYAPQALPPKAVRNVGFTYGLGTISSTRSRNAKLSLSAGGPFHAGTKFWIVALVQNPKVNQSVRLELPDGMSLSPNHSATQPVVPGADVTQVSWLAILEPTCSGSREIKAVLTPDAIQETQTLIIQPPKAQLTVMAKGPVLSGKSFWVTTIVRNPTEGQTVELELPSGLAFNTTEVTRKPVPVNGSYSQISWLLSAERGQQGERTIHVLLQPESVKQSTTVSIEAGNLVR